MPCGCFGKKPKTVKGKLPPEDITDAPYTSLKSAPLKSKPNSNWANKADDDPKKRNASSYNNECELIEYKNTGSRPSSGYTSSDTVPLLDPPPSPPNATSSPTQSSPTSTRSGGASCRAELAAKRREFFKELGRGGTPLSSTLPSQSKLNSMKNSRPNSLPAADVTTRKLFNGQIEVNLKSAKLPRGKDLSSEEINGHETELNESDQKPPTPPPPYEGEVLLDKSFPRQSPHPSSPPQPKHIKAGITPDKLQNVNLKHVPTPQIKLHLTDEEFEDKEVKKMEMQAKDDELFSLIENQSSATKEDLDELMDIIGEENTNIDPGLVEVKEESKPLLSTEDKPVSVETKIETVNVSKEIESISSDTTFVIDSQVSENINTDVKELIEIKQDPPSLQDTLMQISPPLPEEEIIPEQNIIDSSSTEELLEKDAEIELLPERDIPLSGGLSPIIEESPPAPISIQDLSSALTNNIDHASIPSAPVQTELLDNSPTEELIEIKQEDVLSQMVSEPEIPTEKVDVLLETPSTIVQETKEIISNINMDSLPEPKINIEQPIADKIQHIVETSPDSVKETTIENRTIIDGDNSQVVTKKTTVVTSQVVSSDIDPEMLEQLLNQDGTEVTKITKTVVKQSYPNDSDLTNVNVVQSEEEFDKLIQMVDPNNGETLQALTQEFVSYQEEVPINNLINEDDFDESEIPQLINVKTGHVLEADSPLVAEQMIDVRLEDMPSIPQAITITDLSSGKKNLPVEKSHQNSEILPEDTRASEDTLSSPVP